MAGKSSIEWTEQTWNPIVGCSILTPGCTNCYAMKMAARIEAMKRSHYDGTTKRVKGNAVWTGKLALAPDHVLLAPLHRKKPTTYFVNSMGDLFHEGCSTFWITKVLAVMAMTPHHTYQVLTKRAGIMRAFMSDLSRRNEIELAAESIKPNVGTPFSPRYSFAWPLPNIWLGVSAERQQEADERIPLLLQTPAAIRFVSAEPLLGPIDLEGWRTPDCDTPGQTEAAYAASATGNKLDWIIVGGESGSRARPMHPDWARSLRDQCAAAGVAFFFKQWGEWLPGHQYTPELHARDNGVFSRYACMDWEGSKAVQTDANPGFDDTGDHAMWRVGKKAAGRLLDSSLHNAMPERVRG